MSLVDSPAAFVLRCDEVDDSKQMSILLGRQGINTFSSLAFAIGTPSQPPSDAAFALRIQPPTLDVVSPNDSFSCVLLILLSFVFDNSCKFVGFWR